jgi:hypothetical protein
VPIRPYTSFFIQAFGTFGDSARGISTSLFELIIIIFIIGAMIGQVANRTTGITIAHAGFTPDPNLTASPGAVPLTQLFPLVFIAVGLMAAFDHFKHKDAGA